MGVSGQEMAKTVAFVTACVGVTVFCGFMTKFVYDGNKLVKNANVVVVAASGTAESYRAIAKSLEEFCKKCEERAKTDPNGGLINAAIEALRALKKTLENPNNKGESADISKQLTEIMSNFGKSLPNFWNRVMESFQKGGITINIGTSDGN